MKYIAFLRGINVGGKIVKMDRLREVLGAAGFENVKTYIQSGNVVLESELRDESDVRALIEETVAREFFPTPVMVRTRDEVKRLYDSNPFADQEFEEKWFHLVFLDEELTPEKTELLLAQQCDTEEYATAGREIYCLLRAGVADSTLGKRFLETKLKVSATARNWRTIGKVLEL